MILAQCIRWVCKLHGLNNPDSYCKVVESLPFGTVAPVGKCGAYFFRVLRIQSPFVVMSSRKCRHIPCCANGRSTSLAIELFSMSCVKNPLKLIIIRKPFGLISRSIINFRSAQESEISVTCARQSKVMRIEALKQAKIDWFHLACSLARTQTQFRATANLFNIYERFRIDIRQFQWHRWHTSMYHNRMLLRWETNNAQELPYFQWLNGSLYGVSIR